MKKLLLISTIGVCILSWIFFLLLSFLAFSPWSLIKTIDHYALPSYTIEFSKIHSSGNALNRNLKFFDFLTIGSNKSSLKSENISMDLKNSEEVMMYRLIRIFKLLTFNYTC